MSPLLDTLKREIDLISRFILLLDQEQGVLRAAQPELLPAIHDAKASLVEQLNALEKNRISLLGVAREMSDRERMNVWLKEHPAEEIVAGLWQELIELAQSAKQKNELNALLVNLHLEKTTQALAILTRHAQENTLYGSNGQKAIYTGSRIVDSA